MQLPFDACNYNYGVYGTTYPCTDQSCLLQQPHLISYPYLALEYTGAYFCSPQDFNINMSQTPPPDNFDVFDYEAEQALANNYRPEVTVR